MNQRFSRFGLLALLSALVMGLAGNSGFTQPPKEEDPPLTAEKIRTLLRKPVSISFTNTSVQECVEQLCAEHQIPVTWEKTILEEIGISLDQPVTVTVEFSHVTTKAALDRILKKERLGWYCTDYGLVIATREIAIQHRAPRVYDVTDLFLASTNTGERGIAIPARPETRESSAPDSPAKGQPGITPARPSTHKNASAQMELPQVKCATGSIQSYSNGSQTGLSDFFNGTPAEYAAYAWLKTLQDSLDDLETAWVDIDGEGGTMSLISTPNAHLLVVSHNDYVHFRTEDLLNELIMMDEDRHQNPEGLGITPDKRADISQPRVRIVTRKAPARSPARATRSRR